MEKRVLAEVIKLRILNWEIILDNLGGPKCNRKCTYKREAEEDLRGQKRRRQYDMEAKTGGMWPHVKQEAARSKEWLHH